MHTSSVMSASLTLALTCSYAARACMHRCYSARHAPPTAATAVLGGTWFSPNGAAIPSAPAAVSGTYGEEQPSSSSSDDGLDAPGNQEQLLQEAIAAEIRVRMDIIGHL